MRTSSMIFVMHQQGDAIYEAVDSGIETVVCIAEGLPAHEMLRPGHRAHPRPRRGHDRSELPWCALAREGERGDHPGGDLP